MLCPLTNLNPRFSPVYLHRWESFHIVHSLYWQSLTQNWQFLWEQLTVCFCRAGSQEKHDRWKSRKAWSLNPVDMKQKQKIIFYFQYLSESQPFAFPLLLLLPGLPALYESGLYVWSSMSCLVWNRSSMWSVWDLSGLVWPGLRVSICCVCVVLY